MTIITTTGLPLTKSAPLRLRRPDRETVYKVVSYSSPLVLLLIWEVLARADILPTRVLPAPSAVLGTGLDLIETGELQANLLVSTTRALSGLAVGTLIGLGLGIVVGFSRLGDAVLDRSLQMVRAIPFFAMLPLIIIWFGVGEVGKLFLIAKAVTFPIYLNAVLGIRQVDPKLLELAQVAKLTRWETITRIILPGALPSILGGFRMAITVAWLALIVAETIGARSGLGFLAADAREYLRTDVIVLTIIVYAAIGILSDIVARKLEATLLRWHPNYARRSS